MSSLCLLAIRSGTVPVTTVSSTFGVSHTVPLCGRASCGHSSRYRCLRGLGPRKHSLPDAGALVAGTWCPVISALASGGGPRQGRTAHGSLHAGGEHLCSFTPVCLVPSVRGLIPVISRSCTVPVPVMSALSSVPGAPFVSTCARKRIASFGYRLYLDRYRSSPGDRPVPYVVYHGSLVLSVSISHGHWI